MTDHLIETFHDGVATLTMNRPEARNALSGEMQAALSEALPRLSADRAVRVIVITGAGAAFCAGGDVKGFAARNTAASDGGGRFDLEDRVHGLRAAMEVSRHLAEAPKPTLAVIPGPAAGAGLVGAAKARELYFTADVISGEEAQKLGIVNEAVPSEEIQVAGERWAKKLANLPTVAVGYMKRNLNAAAYSTLPEVLDLEAMHMVRTFMTEDHRQATAAFVEKRPPVFQGR
jgi:2-(1,2-epoxy-1,2-dihydrophenyl)acetyl-CoA isomerase